MKPKTIQLSALRWFQKSAGNTYHRVHVYVTWEDGTESSFDSGIHYGYDQQYRDTAAAILRTNGIPDITFDMWRYCEERGIELLDNVRDVQRERDLKAFTI